MTRVLSTSTKYQSPRSKEQKKRTHRVLDQVLNSVGCSTVTMPADVSLSLLAGSNQASRGSDYLENQCASAPLAVCNFKPVEGSILKTVDAVYANVISPQQCKKLCMRARFRYVTNGTTVYLTARHIDKEPTLMEAEQSCQITCLPCFSCTVEAPCDASLAARAPFTSASISMYHLLMI